MRIRHIPLFGSVGVLLAATVVAAFPTQALGDTGCPTAVAPSLVSSTYEVDTAAKLQWVKDSGSMSATYKLTGNINMSGCTWSNGIATNMAPFTGTFDGNGKTVSNLTVSGGGTQGLGLVDFVGASGSVTNLTVASPSVTGTSNYVGGVVGQLRTGGSVSNITLINVAVTGGQYTGGAIGDVATGATVSTVSVSGTVSAPSGVGGGVVGASQGTMSGLTSTASVSGAYDLGGLVGDLNYAGTLSNSTSSGNVGGAGASSVGGAVGSIAGVSPSCGTITGVATSGNVSGSMDLGGLLGYGNCFYIYQSSSSAAVVATSSEAGGLLGYDNTAGRIEKSFFTGSVTATEKVGGIAGATRSTIVDSYSSGTVTATSATNGGIAGGLVGRLLSGAVITRSIARGLVTPPAGGSSTVGGLIGQHYGGTIPSGLWDKDATGLSTSQGTGAQGYTSQQLKDHVLYNADNLNWDMMDGISSGDGVSTGTVWSVCSGANSGYPFLTRQGLSGTCLPTMAYYGNGNDGGTAPTDASTPYNSGDTVTVVGNTGTLTKTSRFFSGWNTKADGTGTTYISGDTFTSIAPVMLFAVWTTSPQIIYRANDGTGTIANTSGATGASVTLSTGSGFSRTGYTLSRWDTSSGGNGVSYSKSQVISMPAGGLTLYAVWTALPTITYNANGGTGSVSTQYAASGASVTLSTGSGFTRTGYTLSRWDTSSGGGGVSYSKNESVTMPAGGLNLFAVWTALPAVTYNANGGSGTVATQYALGGDALVLDTGSGFTRTGYTLSRWDTSSGGGGVSYSKNESILMPPGGLTLYAVWTSTSTTTTAAATTTVAPATTTTVASTTSAAPGSGSTTTVASSATAPSSASSVPAASVPAAPGSGGTASGGSSAATTTTAPSARSTGASSGPAAAPATTVTATTSTLATANGPDVPGVATGEVGATIGGSPATVRVEARDNSLVVTVGDATVSYSVKDRTGARRGVSAASALTLQPGDTLTVGFTGFGSGFVARARLLPEGTPLGEMRLADGSGSIVSVLADTTPAGDHRIVTEAASKDGKPVVVAYGVKVVDRGSSRSPWSVVLLVIVGLAVALGLLVPASRRRREEEENPA